MQTAVESQLAGQVNIALDGVQLRAEFLAPTASRGVVVFVHGSGSSGRSPRNRYVAQLLRGHRIGTLLLDLLTLEEVYSERDTHHLRWDIDLLGDRVVAALDWVGAQPEAHGLPLGIFGASTGAAAALVAAAQRPREVAAVVCRGGRPDLAGEWLPRVHAATLLVVGTHDPDVLNPNLTAFEQLGGPKSLKTVPGAGHLFEEPGAIESLAALTAEWFDAHLGTAASHYSSML